jgi:hypothetical protein
MKNTLIVLLILIISTIWLTQANKRDNHLINNCIPDHINQVCIYN